MINQKQVQAPLPPQKMPEGGGLGSGFLGGLNRRSSILIHSKDANKGNLAAKIFGNLRGKEAEASMQSKVASQSTPQSSSSQGSSTNDRINAIKHFTEMQRLEEAFRMYSTLEDHTQIAAEYISHSADERSGTKLLSGGANRFSKDNKLSRYDISDYASNSASSAIYKRLKEAFIRRLFKINHLLLRFQSVSLVVYQIMMLIEHFQMLFFAFYEIQIFDEFYQAVDGVDISLQNSSGGDPSNSSFNDVSNQGTTSIQGSNKNTSSIKQSFIIQSASNFASTQQYNPYEKSFQLDSALKYFNFPLLILESHQASNFMQLYIWMLVIFFVIAIAMVASAEGLFQIEKNELGGLKDEKKLVVKVSSVVIAVLIFICQIPMMIVIFQGYLCEEDLDMKYTIDIACQSIEHQIMIGFSTLALIVFICFLAIERLLFTSRQFQTEIPWASLESRFGMFKLIVKLVQTTSFIFDKQGNTRAYVNFICFLLLIVILFNRVTRSHLLNEKSFFATLAYETMLSWLFLTSALAIFFEYILTLTSFTLILFVGVCLTGILITYMKIQKLNHEMIKNPSQTCNYPYELELYFYRLYSLIKRPSDESGVKLLGVLFNHLHECPQTETCACARIISKIDGMDVLLDDVNQLREIEMLENQLMEAEEEEEAAIEEEKKMNSTQGQDAILERGISIGTQKGIQRLESQASQKTLQVPSTNSNHLTVSQFQRGATLAFKRQNSIRSNKSYLSQKAALSKGAAGPSQFKQQSQFFAGNRKGLPPLQLNVEAFDASPNDLDDDSFITEEEEEEDEKNNASMDQLTAIGKQDENFLKVSGNNIKSSSYNSSRITQANNGSTLLSVSGAMVGLECSGISQQKQNLRASNSFLQRANSNRINKTQAMLNVQKALVSKMDTYRSHKPANTAATKGSKKQPTLHEQGTLHQSVEDQERIKESEQLNKTQSAAAAEAAAEAEKDRRNFYTTLGERKIMGVDPIQEELFRKIKHYDFEKQMIEFLCLLVQEAIYMFPNDVDLKLVLAFLQRTELKNEFKAVFEVMNSELCPSTFQNQFFIFSMKEDIEQSLLHENDRMSIKVGSIDVRVMHQYEKGFLKYALLEYITSNSALGFWRELLQKTIDASAIQQRGVEISKNYAKLQDIASSIQQIFPNDLEFLFRYALFLKSIVNNAYDAGQIFEKIIIIYNSKIARKKMEWTESESILFGENSGAAIIIMEGTSVATGRIMHVNQETFTLTGYQVKEMLGRNVSLIMPGPIGRSHESLVQRYFETGEKHMVDSISMQHCVHKSGYLRLIRGLIKVYPQITDKITFMGFFQAWDQFEGMDPPKEEFKSFEQHYVVTDEFGNITNISEGLNDEIGLHSKFFSLHGPITNNISFSLICPEILDPDIEEGLEMGGLILTINTKEILDFVEIEVLSSEEVLSVKSRLNIQQAYVQLRKTQYAGGLCKVNYYRVIFGGEAFNNSLDKTQDRSNVFRASIVNIEQNNVSRVDLNNNPDHDDSNGELKIASMDGSAVSSIGIHSFDSQGTNVSSFNKMVQDFKHALNVRKKPQSIKKLNLLISMFTIISAIIGTVEYYYKQQVIGFMEEGTEHFLQTQLRYAYLIEEGMFVRTLIDIANGFESPRYNTEGVSVIDRFDYLHKEIMAYQSKLQQSHQFCTLQRIDDDVAEGTPSQSAFEYEPVDLNILDSTNKIFTYQQPFRVALQTYLNYILMVNSTLNPLQFELPFDILQGIPTNATIYQATMPLQKVLSFLLLNGLRSLRDKTLDANIFQVDLAFSYTRNDIFLTFMVVGIFTSFVSIAVTLFYIWHNERNKTDILSLYALLRVQDIKNVYDKCDEYLDGLLEDGGVGTQDKNKKGGGGRLEDSPSSSQSQSSFQDSHSLSNRPVEKNITGQGFHRQLLQSNFSKRISAAMSNKRSVGRPSVYSSQIMVSEEDKEEMEYQHYLKSHKGNTTVYNRTGNDGVVRSHRIDGRERFKNLVKNAMDQLKEIQEQSQLINNIQKLAILSSNRESLKEGGPQNHQQEEDINTQRKLLMGKKAMLQRVNTKRRRVINGFPNPNGKDNGGGARDSFDGGDDDDERQEDSHCSIDNIRMTSLANQEAYKKQDKEIDKFEQRKLMFNQSVKVNNFKFLLWNSFFGLLVSVYYVSIFIYHLDRIETVKVVKNYSPIFFQRYTDVFLSYGLIRERIIGNNSLSSFAELGDEHSPQNIDQYYKDRSIAGEQKIQSFKSMQDPSLKTLVDFVKRADSEQFCEQTFDQNDQSVLLKELGIQANKAIKISILKQSAYELQIQTVIASCLAARAGNVTKLEIIRKSTGFDFKAADYDKRTPLHVASAYGQIEVVKYLIEQANVPLNPQDRWGATPLSDAVNHTQIRDYLRSKNATVGTSHLPYERMNSSISENQYRLYYAAYYGDVQMMQNLRLLEWNVNGQDYDGRTALHIAASQGNYDAVRYLIAFGSELDTKDARGNDPIQDSIREGHFEVHEYLLEILDFSIVSSHCTIFENGLLAKGIQQALGSFSRKFEDLQIAISLMQSQELLLTLLNGNRSNVNSTSADFYVHSQRSIEQFITTSELYLHRSLDKMVAAIRQTLNSILFEFESNVKILFIVFLVYLSILLIFLRHKLIQVMLQDVFLSRGILNLIPEHFFAENREQVEQLIKKLQY